MTLHRISIKVVAFCTTILLHFIFRVLVPLHPMQMYRQETCWYGLPINQQKHIGQ